MRTVLVTDEMLARAVEDSLAGRCHLIGRIALRKLGREAAVIVRELVTASPCVLAIGARAWDPLPMIEAMRLPYKVPVIMLAPSVTWESVQRAMDADVFSTVPLDGSVSGLSSAVAVECQLAADWLEGYHPRTLRPVVVSRTRLVPARDQRQASVVDLAAYRQARGSA